MKESLAYLNECETDIDDFTNKVKEGGFLRTATLSHLRKLFLLNKEEAIKVLDYWINEYKP